MRVTVLESLQEIPAASWNSIAGDNPFLQHEFLHSLEATGCVGPGTGWEARHLAAFDPGCDRNRLLGAVPLYVKAHSYGEYVFDWTWAGAYERSGRSYYPKLVAAVPFTPATGRRLLTATDVDEESTVTALIAGALEVADALNASSLHWLFPTARERDALTARGFLGRSGCQFHWSNPGYRDFEDFLSTFTAHKRKNIRRERRRVQEAGVTVEVLRGREIASEHWDLFYRFYRTTIRAHGAIAYLSRDFFHLLGEQMAERTILMLARRGREPVGAAFGLHGERTLYGRYWGGRTDIPDLHFETCYYTPIEHCIEHGIQRYEAGAQGEHKLARGFLPTETYSAHWLRDPGLRRAVADFLAREQGHVAQYMDELNEHTPFRDASIARG